MIPQLTRFLREIENSVNEKFAVIYHGVDGLRGFHIIGEGDAEGVKFTPQDIFDAARTCNASMVTLVHNHPTGDVRPSQPDLVATFEMQDMLKARGMSLFDHVILGPKGNPFSFRENGVI